MEELEGMNVRLNPGREILRQGSLRKGIIAGSQSGYKDLSLVDLSGLRVGDLHRLSGIVDKELLSSPVFLVETGIELLGPLVVAVAKLTVLVSLRTFLLVFMPEKLKGNPFLL
jgi:hypothetical protein